MAYTDIYDSLFQKQAKLYFPDSCTNDPNFQLQFKAQSIAESRLNKMAISPVKAKGLMQIMPGTFMEQCQKLGIQSIDVFDPNTNIRVGIFYDMYLFKQQKSERPLVDRLSFMFASYNAGLGNILKAQKVCLRNHPDKNPNLQKSITEVADRVPTWKYEETLTYVERIIKYKDQITVDI